MTVKPLDLMRHLVRLVTPSGGTVLDPFLGSGTTAIAAEMEGFAWIGIEREPEYVAIAEARLMGVQKGLGLDVPAPTSKATAPTAPDENSRRAARGRKPHNVEGWHFPSGTPPAQAYGRLKQQRKEERRSAWQARRDAEDEYSDSITELIEQRDKEGSEQ